MQETLYFIDPIEGPGGSGGWDPEVGKRVRGPHNRAYLVQKAARRAEDPSYLGVGEF